MKLNNKGFAVTTMIYSVLILFLIIIFGILSVLGSRKLTLDKMKKDVMNSLNGDVVTKEYKDESGANPPLLLDNMIPIRYDGTNWVYADPNEEWYDYDKQQWANAVVLNYGITKTVGERITEYEVSLWYVWIPRYKYTIFNGDGNDTSDELINVTFERGIRNTGTVICSDAINQSNNGNLVSEICIDSTGNIDDGLSTYTHPAFTFGDKELTGIWVGKFENGGSLDELKIRPNIVSLRADPVDSFPYSIEDFAYSIQDIEGIYEIYNGDSHLMKNSEWGAVAYLKQSQYGLGTTDIGINNNSNYMTGCGASAGTASTTTCNSYNTENGMLASTTGNIYGIYDMSGGAYEYVMGKTVSISGMIELDTFWFIDTEYPTYYDAYTYDSLNTSHSRGKLGDATKEVRNWYDDYASFATYNSPWMVRGSFYDDATTSGIFYYSSNVDSDTTSINYGSRSVLVSR